MKSLVIIAIVALTPVIVSAQEFSGCNLSVSDHFTIGRSEQHPGTLSAVTFDNVTNFTGLAFVHGGATNQGGNTITILGMDDVTPSGLTGDVSGFKFSVANFDAVAVSARARVRFWYADGAAGGPGTYYSVPAAVGFTFNPIAFAPGVTVVSAEIGAGQFTMPTGTFWAGVTFDDNGGTTGATVVQLNNLGQGVFNPPVVGSSTDQIFLTSAAGSFFGTNNPAGNLQNFGGNVAANLGWEFEVLPEPATLVALAVGVAGLLARRGLKS